MTEPGVPVVHTLLRPIAMARIQTVDWDELRDLADRPPGLLNDGGYDDPIRRRGAGRAALARRRGTHNSTAPTTRREVTHHVREVLHD
jgi:hypothetical protein